MSARALVRSPRARWVVVGAVVVWAAALPFLTTTFWLRLATGLFMWIALAQAWNMVGGYTGLISFGHGAFFGLGAYTSGLLVGAGWSFPMALVVAVAVPAVTAAVIGLPTLRLRGAYFAIATWAFAEFVRQGVLVTDATGGSSGMRVELILDERLIYYAMLVAALAWLALAWWLLERRPFGLRLRAIRDHRDAAEMLGVATTRMKMEAFVLSAAVTGAFGSIYGVWITFLHPDNVLSPTVSDLMVVMTLLGGLGAFVGPLLGAPLLFAIERAFWLLWSDNFAYLLVTGALVALVVLFMPNGMAGLFRGRGPRRRVRANLRELKARVGA